MKLLAWIAGAGILALQTGQTFRSGTEGVHVDVLVTDGNRPVMGLTATDFEVRDSGVLQQIDSVALEDVPLNVLLVLDTSDSVMGTPLVHLKAAASAVLDLLHVNDRAALLTFSHELTVRSPWSPPEQVKSRVESTLAAGGTSLYDAAYAALTMESTGTGRSLVLVFSDGEDTRSWLPGSAVVDVARRSDSVVYAVGLTRGRAMGLTVSGVVRPGYRFDFSSGLQRQLPQALPDKLLEQFLPALAEQTGGRYMDATRTDELRDTFVRIVNEFRSRYLLMYTPRGVDAAGWHPLEVKLKGKRGKVTARRGYLR